MRDRFRLLLGFSLLFVVPTFATEAVAASRQSQERAARKACITGDYTKGVAILADLFLDTKNPTYIYNQGRCFEQNSRFEDAVARFEEYLRVPEGTTSDKDKAEAEKHLAACRQKLEQDRAAQAALQPVPAPSPKVPDRYLSESTPPPAPTTDVRAQKVQSEGGHNRGLLISGIITAALGAGGVALGVVYNLKANQLARDVETAPAGTYSSSKENDQKSKRTISIAAYSAGAACLAVGAILMTVGLSSGPSSSSTVALSPTVGSSQVGAVLTGSF